MTTPIARILVPVDFSEHSERALRYAADLAARLGASLDVLHVVQNPITAGALGSEIAMPDLSGLLDGLMQEARRRLEGCRALVAGHDVPIRDEVLIGHPSPAIAEYASTHDIDLIVMGTHGRTGLAHLFVGSVAERVLRHAPCPVLAVREKTAAAR